MESHLSWMRNHRVFYDMYHGSWIGMIWSMIYGMFVLLVYRYQDLKHAWFMAIFNGLLFGHLNVLQWKGIFHACVFIGFLWHVSWLNGYGLFMHDLWHVFRACRTGYQDLKHAWFMLYLWAHILPILMFYNGRACFMDAWY